MYFGNVYAVVACLVLAANMPPASVVAFWADEPVKRLPVPDAASQAKSLQAVRSLYGEEFEQATSPLQKARIAEKLFDQALATQQDPTGRYVLLNVAMRVGVEAGDISAAFRAIEEMARSYEIDGRKLKSTVLADMARPTKTRTENRAFAATALAAINGVIADDDYETAQRLAELALPAAQKARDGTLVRQIRAKTKEIEEGAEAYQAFQNVLATLKEKPDDPAASLAAGCHYCFRKGDWERGIPLLAHGDNADLKAVAQRELAGVPVATDMVKTAEIWYDLAQREPGVRKAAMLDRAAHWYRRALPKLSGLTELQARKRMEEIGRSSVLVGDDVVNLHIAVDIDGSDTVQFHRAFAKWTHHTWGWPKEVTINEFSWSPKQMPTLQYIGEFSKTMKYADFSSAELEKIKGRGQVTLKKAADYIEVNFDDGAGGSDSYEVIVTLKRLGP
ncbi:MAG: hypothetical protein ABIK89_01190 [Planctomycetota bacterium]